MSFAYTWQQRHVLRLYVVRVLLFLCFFCYSWLKKIKDFVGVGMRIRGMVEISRKNRIVFTFN